MVVAILAGGTVRVHSVTAPPIPVVQAMFQGSGMVQGIAKTWEKAGADVVIVGPYPLDDFDTIPAGKTLGESVEKALAYKTGPIVLTSADIPLLRVDDAQEILRLGNPNAPSLIYGYGDMAQVNAVYPSLEKTTVKIGGRKLCGSNVSVVNDRSALLRVMNQISPIMAERKRPDRMARTVGADMLWRFALAQTLCPNALTIQSLEEWASKRVGSPVVGHQMPVSTAFDVDNYPRWQAALIRLACS